jgi:hypothetical protein
MPIERIRMLACPSSPTSIRIRKDIGNLGLQIGSVPMDWCPTRPASNIAEIVYLA